MTNISLWELDEHHNYVLDYIDANRVHESAASVIQHVNGLITCQSVDDAIASCTFTLAELHGFIAELMQLKQKLQKEKEGVTSEEQRLLQLEYSIVVKELRHGRGVVIEGKYYAQYINNSTWYFYLDSGNPRVFPSIGVLKEYLR